MASLTLSEIRQKVVELSGRFDLVTDYWSDDYSDNGADFFIQSAQRWLEKRPEFPMTADLAVKAIWSKVISSGDYSVELPLAVRVLERVELIDEADSARGFLKVVTFKELREIYRSQDDFSAIDQGEPSYAAIAPRRSIDGDDNDTVKSTQMLFFMPPADGTYSIKVEVVAEQKELTADTDTNYFTIKVPELLIAATLWNLSKWYKDRQGADDYLSQVEEYLSGLHRDVIRQSVADNPKLPVLW